MTYHSILKMLCLLAGGLLSAAGLKAQEFQVGDLTYSVTSGANRTCEITKCDAAATAVTIPATVQYGGTTYTVDKASDKAFQGCTALESVDIPENISKIGNYTFNNCTALKSVHIPGSVSEIGEGVFQGCTSLTAVTLPSRLRRIKNNLFNGCSSLKAIQIPAATEYIAYRAFYGCYSLSSLRIPRSVKELENGLSRDAPD